MLGLQVDKDALEHVIEQVLGGRRFVEGVVHVVQHLELVGCLAQLGRARIGRTGEILLGLCDDLARRTEDSLALGILRPLRGSFGGPPS